MALDTYANLRTALTDRLARADATTARVADFITLAEADMNRELRLIDQEVSTALSVSSATTALPSDYLEMRSAPRISTNPTAPLEYKTPEQIEQMGTDSGSPLFYSIRGSNLLLGPPPDGTYTVTIYYFKQIAALSDANTSNFILTDWPTLYLNGALAYGYDYFRNIALSDRHRAIFELLLNSINRNGKWSRYSGAALAVRVG